MSDDLSDIIKNPNEVSLAKNGWSDVLISVGADGTAILFSEPAIDDYRFKDFLEECGTVLLNDNAVNDIPEKPGIYKCFISCVTTGPDYNGEYDCIVRVVNPLLLWSPD